MNRLLEVYSKGLYDSLNKEGITEVVEHFQNISNDSSVHGLAGLFKNKTERNKLNEYLDTDIFKYEQERE